MAVQGLYNQLSTMAQQVPIVYYLYVIMICLIATMIVLYAIHIRVKVIVSKLPDTEKFPVWHPMSRLDRYNTSQKPKKKPGAWRERVITHSADYNFRKVKYPWS